VSPGGTTRWPLVSIVIPARNEARLIAEVVRSVRQQVAPVDDIEIIVVDDGSTDATVALAHDAGARVIEMRPSGETGNAAATRNRGAAASRGDPIVFLDADCVAAEGWLAAILRAHERATIVGGSLALPAGLPASARCDYYCGWYLVHPRARAGFVPHHPPPNLSVRREPFMATAGFSTRPPLDYTNEERHWQGQLRSLGHRIYFEPGAVAAHHNHPGIGNLLRRNYRWAYTAVEAKSQSGAARAAWLYRYPWLLILASPLLVMAHTALILFCWLRVRVLEPLWMSPVILASRVTYVTGLCVGAVRWIRTRHDSGVERPRPRWQ
jgi:glycosyltransferase involved in cell wall biosynthesis